MSVWMVLHASVYSFAFSVKCIQLIVSRNDGRCVIKHWAWSNMCKYWAPHKSMTNIMISVITWHSMLVFFMFVLMQPPSQRLFFPTMLKTGNLKETEVLWVFFLQFPHIIKRALWVNLFKQDWNFCCIPTDLIIYIYIYFKVSFLYLFL